jgi:hypothetical protein
MEICEYCGETFNTFESVIGHQQRNKKCLRLQGRNNIKCEFCNKFYISQRQFRNSSETM